MIGAPSLLVSTRMIAESTPGNGGERLERPVEHLVEVDRARDLAQEAGSPALLLGLLDRAAEVGGELVQAPLDVRDPAAASASGAHSSPTSSSRQTQSAVVAAIRVWLTGRNDSSHRPRRRASARKGAFARPAIPLPEPV